jgi:CO/xanthine dehydrogenase FAD-binding subunit
VDFYQPTNWADALAVKAAVPSAVAVAGGTDLMVEVNFGRRRPDALLDLTRVAGLADWGTAGARVRLGAAVSYTRLIRELAALLPGLAVAARTVASPQIRNRGTIGGNLGTASPAGDCHPPLLAAGADIEVASVRGTRMIAAEDFFAGPKRTVLSPDELIAAVHVTTTSGPQQFSKIGTRNAMVIAVVSVALSLRPDRRIAGVAIGSAAPTPRRAADAERFLAGELEAARLWETRAELPPELIAEFARRVRAAADPVDDVRGTAAYRLHALEVMARRSLRWAWQEYGSIPVAGQEGQPRS